MNEFSPLAWSALLLFIGCVLIVSEVFIPSGGILGFLAASAILTSIVMSFYHHGPAVGFSFVATSVVAIPVVVALAFKYWPYTPIGRRFLLGLPTSDEVLPDDDRHLNLKQLVGKRGTAKSPMLPGGHITIEGNTVDAVSQGMSIEAGQKVVVVEVKGNRVVVRPLTGDEPPESIHDAKQDDVLSQPLDALGLDPLDDPLA